MMRYGTAKHRQPGQRLNQHQPHQPPCEHDGAEQVDCPDLGAELMDGPIEQHVAGIADLQHAAERGNFRVIENELVATPVRADFISKPDHQRDDDCCQEEEKPVGAFDPPVPDEQCAHGEISEEEPVG